jgi:hypothetical protein
MAVPAPNPSDQPSPDQQLIEAARAYARRVTGQSVTRVTLTLADGSKRKLDVPAQAGFATDWPPPEGWGVRGDRGSRDGVAFRLAGKSLAAFAVLVEAGDAGATLAELKAAVWDRHTDDRTVQNALSKLRSQVRAALGLGDADEVIEADGERYRLAAG